jgi:tetratricopeptide (TPR) repeat protein
MLEELIKAGKYELALKDIEDSLTSDRYNLSLLSLKATLLTKIERYNDAIATHKSLINLLPNNAEYHAERGITYHKMGEVKLSLVDFNKAVELDPENGYRYSSRAFIKDYLGDQLGALDDYNKAVELDPDDAVSFNNRGLIEEKLGRMQLSQESFAHADNISGIDLTTSVEPQDFPILSNEKKAYQKNLSIKYFFDVIKKLLSSSGERKRFYKFLFKRS